MEKLRLSLPFLFAFKVEVYNTILYISIMGFLVSFVKNDKIRPSVSCQIMLEKKRKGKKSTQFLKGTTRYLF